MQTSRGADASDRGRSPGQAVASLARREVRLEPLLGLASRRRTEIILGFGVVLRLAQYLANRQPWMDEMSLRGNITTRTLAGLFGPLKSTQLAPPGFLVVEWVAYHLLGGSSLVLRLFPLVCALASLFLFQRVAVRCLRPRAVWIALLLFAVSDDLIYYASELKQYSSDVAVALLCDLEAMALLDRPARASRLGRFAALGALAVWFSHPSAFVLAGLGTVLLVQALRDGDWRRLLGLGLACLAWLASFAALYLVAQEQLGHRSDMWRFWDFAFPPMPPRSLGEAAWGIRRIFYLFVNPLDFSWPLGPRISPLPALACFLAGCASMSRRGQGPLLGMLTAPLLFALLAAYLHLYPFHGRLVLFLVPSLLLLIAEGAAWIGELSGRRAVRTVLVAVLLALPTLRALAHVIEPTMGRSYNPRGDLRPPGLDPVPFPF